MDPRPYHFEYRRPRVQNPTYQSIKLYESIYHFDKFHRDINPENKAGIPKQKTVPKSQSQQMQRHQSFDVMSSNNKINRYNNSKQPQANLNSSMSQYGNNIMNNQLFEQNRIYEKQEKAFNIINNYPKTYEPKLKRYPKFTLEHMIGQNSRNASPQGYAINKQ